MWVNHIMSVPLLYCLHRAQLQADIFACLAALLHLGNVQFTEDDKECSHIVNPQTGPLKTVSVSTSTQLLQATLFNNIKTLPFLYS